MNTTPDDLPRSLGQCGAAGWIRDVVDRYTGSVRLLRRVLAVGDIEGLLDDLARRGVRVTRSSPGRLPEGPFDMVVLGPDAVFPDRGRSRRLLSDLAGRLRAGGRAVAMIGPDHDSEEYGRLMQGAGFDPPAVLTGHGSPGGTLLMSRLRLWKAGRVP